MKEIKSNHRTLDSLGLLDEGQPTQDAHRAHVEKMSQEFSAQERRMIRAALYLEVKATEERVNAALAKAEKAK